MAEKKEVAVKQPLIEEQALAKINQYVSLGMVTPEGFSPVNSLKKARMMLNDMKVNGKPVLEVCTPQSVLQCLIDSCCKGLDFSSNQIYFIPRGNQMTAMESVYGRIVRAKRASKNYKPIVQYVHEGDTFEIGVDTTNGKTIIKKHETNLENQDKPIIAAYTFVADNDGDTNIFIMTKTEWLRSWKKSSNGCAVAKEFERDMIYRTIIKKSTKALVNSDIISFGVSADDEDTPLADDKQPIIPQSTHTNESVEEFVEADEIVEDVDKETGEIKAKEQIEPSNDSKQEVDEDF